MDIASAIRLSEKLRLDTSVELFALLEQYSELQFEGIATGDKLWVYFILESDSMFAAGLNEVILRLRPGILIKNIMISVVFTARQLIALDALPKGQKWNQEYFTQNVFSSLLNEKKHLSRQKIATNFSLHMNNSMCHNMHRIVDELRRLKIFRASHPPYSQDISPCNFWIFGDFKAKLKDCHLPGLEEILKAFPKLRDSIILEELQMGFE
jgi:histone-lysine N-methyltransferase SETMAR